MASFTARSIAGLVMMKKSIASILRVASMAMRADGSMLSIVSLFGSRPSLRIIARAMLVM
ncbi:hypothetical protein D3C83_167250 [compost metagenome]